MRLRPPMCCSVVVIIDLHNQNSPSIERISSFEEFFNAHYPDHPLYFDGQDKERTKNGLSIVQDQSSGVNHQVQFIVDAESNASNDLNSGYHGYNNENLVLNNMTRQVELNMENFYNQNFGVLDEEFGIAYAPIAIEQDRVLQSQSVVKNYEVLPFDASILHIGFEGCTPEDCPELPNNMENDKRGETSTSTKQNLVADSPLTNESPGVLSKEERRKQSNRESQRRCRERKETRVNELEATAKLFNEVKPLLLKILATDTGNIMYEVRKQLEDLIVKNQYAAIAFGIPASPGLKHTSQVVGAKMKRSHSMMRVGSCERLLKRLSGM